MANPKKTNGNVFMDYDANKPLDAADAVALGKAYRAMATAALSEGQTLDNVSDEAIADAVRSIPGSGAPVDMKRAQSVVALIRNGDNETGETGDTDIPERSISAISGDRAAVSLGSGLDETALQHWRELADSDQKVRGAPLILADDLVRNLGKGDKKKGMALVLALPVPGTKEGKEKTFGHLRPGFNGPFEHTKFYVESVEKFRSYYATTYDSSPVGKDNRDLADLLAHITTKNAVFQAGDANRFEQLQKKQGAADSAVKSLTECINSSTLRQMVQDWNNNRRGSVIKKMRLAVNYLQRKSQIDEIPCFDVVLREKSLEALATRTKPIEIQYTPSAEEKAEGAGNDTSGAISIGAMILLKPWLAKERAEQLGKHVDWEILKGTSSRKTDKKGQNAPLFKGLDDVRQAMSSLQTWVEDFGNRTALKGACAGDNEGMDMVVSIHKIGEALDPIRGATAHKYNKWVAEQLTKEQKEDAA